MNDIQYDAELSDCGEYRYRLSRTWDERKMPLVFIMLNPSTADALKDDPTIRRCMGFARRERAGGIVVVNLYGLRATDPKRLWDHPDPIGPTNDRHILKASRQGKIVCAWGGNASPHRAGFVKNLLSEVPLYCFGQTRAGAPRHPLYLRTTQPLERYQP